MKQDLTEVCETRFDLWGKQNSKKEETETTLFRTEATQQKEHTTHNLYIFIRCHFGPLLFALVFAPPSCIGVRTLHLSLKFATCVRTLLSSHFPKVAYCYRHGGRKFKNLD